MFTGRNKRSNSNRKADLLWLNGCRALRSAGGRDAAHFTACLPLGERSVLQPPVQSSAAARSLPLRWPCCHTRLRCSALRDGRRRDRQRHTTALRGFIRLHSQRRAKAAPGQSLCQGVEAGEVLTLVPPQDQAALPPELQASQGYGLFGPGHRFVLQEDKGEQLARPSWQQVRDSCSCHHGSGQNASPRVNEGFPVFQGRARVLWKLTATSLARQRKACFIWSFSEPLG